MMHADSGMKTRTADRPGDDGSQHHISIVQVSVLIFGVAVSLECLVAEYGSPVSPGGLGLDVGAVARADFSRKGFKPPIVAVKI